jgi:uncharacterized iron-regulated protein
MGSLLPSRREILENPFLYDPAVADLTSRNPMRAFVLLAAFSGLLLAGCAGETPALRVESPYRDPATLETGQILHVATGRLLTEPELIDYLSHYRVVYVGEIHDNVEAHAMQLAILKGLEERFPRGVALGLEMLRRPDQESVDAYLRGAMEEKEFAKVWGRSWGARTFPYYRDIMGLVRERNIPVLALNAGRDLLDAIRKEGLDGLDEAYAERLPEMDLDDSYHRAFLEGIFGGHAGGDRQLEAFCQIQWLWDETMAQTAADYLASAEGKDKRLVVFAGGNHVRYGFGIPRRLFRRTPLPYSVVDAYAVHIAEERPDKLMDVDLPELPMRPADVYWAVGYEDLEDQRVMLGVQLEPLEEGGVRVAGIVPDGPAAAAGIEVGDVIVSLGGSAVQEVFDVTYELSGYAPGETHPLELIRGDQRLTLDVTYEVFRHGR